MAAAADAEAAEAVVAAAAAAVAAAVAVAVAVAGASVQLRPAMRLQKAPSWGCYFCQQENLFPTLNAVNSGSKP